MRLDTAELEARLEERIVVRVVREVARLMAGGNGAPDRWIGRKEICALINRKPSAFDALAREGKLPKHAVIMNGQKLWRESEIEAWRKEREERGQV